MANRQVTKDVSDNIIAGAVLADFFLDKTARLVEAHASDHTRVQVNKGGYLIPLKIGDHWFLIDTATDVDLDSDMDTGVKAAGTDYYVYACTDGSTISFKISANSTVPTGFDANHSRKIGGFHTLCTAVGTIGGHTLTGYLQTDILPQSIWDLKHRARCGNNAGMVYDTKTGIWVDIYLASGTGASTASANGGTISDTRDWMDFVDDGGAVGKRLLSDAEFQCAAAGSNEETNISTSADPVTTGGHSDTAARRMISNIGCEDMCGVLWQWLRDQSWRFDGESSALSIAAASATITITHDAAPGGNPLYLKFDAGGNPYLCCNMATDTVDKWLTFGAAYTLLVKHDVGAATGAQVYFDEDATQPSRLLAATPGLQDVYIPTSNPRYSLKVTYNAAPGTPGVAVSYDDGADERLEFTSPTAANGTLDTAVITTTFTAPAWVWENLSGAKGALYHQGTYGDVKLLAGGYWSYGSHCGSRSRIADNDRWNTNPAFGARFASEPL